MSSQQHLVATSVQLTTSDQDIPDRPLHSISDLLAALDRFHEAEDLDSCVTLIERLYTAFDVRENLLS